MLNDMWHSWQLLLAWSLTHTAGVDQCAAAGDEPPSPEPDGTESSRDEKIPISPDTAKGDGADHQRLATPTPAEANLSSRIPATL